MNGDVQIKRTAFEYRLFSEAGVSRCPPSKNNFWKQTSYMPNCLKCRGPENPLSRFLYVHIIRVSLPFLSPLSHPFTPQIPSLSPSPFSPHPSQACPDSCNSLWHAARSLPPSGGRGHTTFVAGLHGAAWESWARRQGSEETRCGSRSSDGGLRALALCREAEARRRELVRDPTGLASHGEWRWINPQRIRVEVDPSMAHRAGADPSTAMTHRPSVGLQAVASKGGGSGGTKLRQWRIPGPPWKGYGGPGWARLQFSIFFIFFYGLAGADIQPPLLMLEAPAKRATQKQFPKIAFDRLRKCYL